ncbi:MAG: hypothetical protein GY760_24410 [Deltaproteobacteria bacterium]|nr:hypothetical protein [Deltaproteobacteria bacterium]
MIRKTKYILFLILIASLLFSFSSSKVFAQDDMDLFEEMGDKKESEKKSDDEDLFNEMDDKEKSDSDEDLFDSMDSNEKKEKKSLNLLKKLWDNLEGSFRVRYNYFPKHAKDREGLDDNLHVGEALFEFSTWTGSDKIQLHTTCWIEAGTQEDSYQGGARWFQDNEYYRRYFECNELYFLFLLSDFDVTLGKKLFNNGISTLYSPSDRFRPSDVHDPLDQKQFGIWQTKVDYYIGDDTLTLAAFPVNTEKKVPAPGSRWWGETDEEGSGSSPYDTAENRSPDIEFKYIDCFVKYKTTISGWDLFVSMNTGPNPYEVLKEEGSTTVRKKIRIATIAGGFSTTSGSLEIHGESLFNYSEGGKDDDYISSVFGITYTIEDWAKYLLMEKIILTIEYGWEEITHKQSADNYTESSSSGRAGQNDLFSKLHLKYNEDLTFDYYANFEFDSKSWMNHFEAKYKIIDGLTLSVAYQVFAYYDSGDGDDGESSNFNSISYKEWDNNDRIITYLKYKF